MKQKEIKTPFLTDKQVGRIVTEMGISNATSEINQVVIDSTKSDIQKTSNPRERKRTKRLISRGFHLLV